MKNLVTMAERKGCHDNDNGNAATATFRQLIETSVQCGCTKHAKDDGGDPGYRVPTG